MSEDTMSKDHIGGTTTPHSPVQFSVEFRGETFELDMFYNQYVMDIVRKIQERYGLSDKEGRKLKVIAPNGETLLKPARLFDIIGPFYAGCLLKIEE